MTTLRQTMFPYALERNSDGTWTLLNRKYKPLGVVSEEFAEYDDPRHKIAAKLTKAHLKKLDHKGLGEGNRIFLYDDGSSPYHGGKKLEDYLAKLAILIKLA